MADSLFRAPGQLSFTSLEDLERNVVAGTASMATIAVGGKSDGNHDSSVGSTQANGPPNNPQRGVPESIVAPRSSPHEAYGDTAPTNHDFIGPGPTDEFGVPLNDEMIPGGPWF